MATVTKKRECAASTISPIPAVPLLIFTNAFFLQRYTVNISTIKFSRSVVGKLRGYAPIHRCASVKTPNFSVKPQGAP
jgi:hypothetical protein